MSSYNDYLASSNNSINDNKVNARRARSTVHQLKKFLRPIFSLIKKNKNTYKRSAQPEYYTDEIDDNLANETLENQIFEEIDCCSEYAAVPVYDDGVMDIIPIFRGEHYIPVHFAKTEAGTFFWTTMMGADFDIDSNGDRNAITEKQLAQVQAPCDRWAQA